MGIECPHGHAYQEIEYYYDHFELNATQMSQISVCKIVSYK